MRRPYSFKFIANFLIICILLIFPYIFFGGKLFLGGDDTRLFYVYPREYLLNVPFFSWLNLSSVGWNFSYQSFLPFVLLWTVLAGVIKSKIVLGYFSFSFPLILGFIFFQMLAHELIIQNSKKYAPEIFAGSLFYIFSPIVINNHFQNPLIPIWLIGLIPALACFFIRFIKQGKSINILIASLLTTVFSFGVHNVPWDLGFVIPISISIFVCSFLFDRENIFIFIKRGVIFFGTILLTQFFWLFGFLVTFFNPSATSFTAKATSSDFVNQFAVAITSTATGNIIYPLLNLFHRKIAFDFDWNLKNIFLIFYDKIYLLGLVYIVSLFVGILNFRKHTDKVERRVFLILLVSFVVSLYLFTVNIGPLLNVFILLGKVPGFILFRTFYDKFALGYSIIFSLLVTYCLIIVRRKFPNIISSIILGIFLFIVLLFALPTKNIIVSPLWTTKNIYKNITIPQEYLSFMNNVKNSVSSTNNILSIPYGISLYSIIKDTNSNNVYAGVSPVVIFSGVNDISGDLSFNYGPEANEVDKAIVARDYNTLNNILYIHNINYVFLTKNVPEEVKESYLFSSTVLNAQDNKFISNITDKKILASAEDNYELYTTKKRNTMISSDNTIYQKESRVKYNISVTNLSGPQEIFFNDTFSSGWKLYLEPASHKLVCKNPQTIASLKTSECMQDLKLFKLSDLSYIWQNPVFENSHKIQNNFSNVWTIDPNFIKTNFDNRYYHVNPDGSLSIQLVLYFKPQVYFYIGTIISVIAFFSLAFYTFVKFNEK